MKNFGKSLTVMGACALFVISGFVAIDVDIVVRSRTSHPTKAHGKKTGREKASSPHSPTEPGVCATEED